MFILAILALGMGIGLLVYSMVKGGSEISLFIIFPVISSDGDPFGIIGIFMISSGIITLYISSFISRSSKSDIYKRNDSHKHERETGKDERDYHDGQVSTEGMGTRFSTGGVVFIGPIPIIFGSDKRIARWMIVVGGLIGFVMLVVFLLQLSRLY